MTTLDFDTLLRHVREESRRFRDVLAGCAPDARVPACPDWDAADLLWHLAEVQWFWARVVRTRPAPPDEDADAPARPTSYDALLAAFDEHSASLLAELEGADPAEPAWHWSTEQTVGTTYRRQAHEALIHRLDAEQAAGTVTPLDPALAADGVLELVDVMYGGPAPDWGRVDPGPFLVRLHLTDPDGSLWVRPGLFLGTDPESGKRYDGPHLQVVADPGPDPQADAVVAGTAADLDAWLWHRRDRTGIAVTGDPAAYDAFAAAVSEPLD